MEASTLQAPATLAKTRVAVGTPLLRLRSDEQLVALFRAGNDEAFRAIHDRYHKRLFAYARQMLPARQDAEDALQDVFVRAYSGLRANDREFALRAWLFRVAHNRCIDELRRPAPPSPEVLQLVRCTIHDPLAEVDRRESLRRLIADVRRLPDQQRSALLMRELGGMPYADLALSLGISVAAVKSVLVRARIALAQAAAARDTECSEIREQLAGSRDRGVRPNAVARKHMRDCAGCRSFRRELRGVARQLAALSPAIGPLGFLAKLIGFSGGAGGGATASGATAGSATAGGGVIAGGGGAAASASGLVLGANHVATLIIAAVATAGGAVAIQPTLSSPPHHALHTRSARAQSQHASPLAAQAGPAAAYVAAATVEPTAVAAAASVSTPHKPRPAADAITRNGRLKRSLRSSAQPNAAGGASMDPTGTTQTTSGSSTGAGLATGAALGCNTGPGTTATTTSDSSDTTSGSSTATSTGSPSNTSSCGSQSSTGTTTGSTSSSTSGGSGTGSTTTSGSGAGGDGSGTSSTGSSGSGTTSGSGTSSGSTSSSSGTGTSTTPAQ